MYSVSFFIASILYVALTLFIFFNYPESWRKNPLFIVLIILWHIIGATCILMVFTVYQIIPNESLKHKVTRVGTCYYVVTTLQSALFFVRLTTSRTYMFIKEHADKKLSEKEFHFLFDKRIHSIVFILISFALFFVGYNNIDTLHLTKYEVSIKAEPVNEKSENEVPENGNPVNEKSENEDFNICLIADIHAGSGTWKDTYDKLAEQIDKANPDVLLIGGDVFDETTGVKDVADFGQVLTKIKQPQYGIYYIYGNHDGKDSQAVEMLRTLNVRILQDEMTVIANDVQLIGCMDPKYGARDFEKLFEECSPDPSKPIIVLTHRPKGFKKMAGLGVDLAMAGHTHGFNIPQFIGAPIFGDMYSGIKKFDDMTAVTTSGVSAWGFHYKWPAISEVVCIHVEFEKK